MAVPTEEVAPERADGDLLEKSFLSYLIPALTDIDIEDQIKRNLSQKSPLDEIESREWLFFGRHYRPLYSTSVSQYSF